MREESYPALAHPEVMATGAVAWVEGDTVGELVRKLQHGDPVRGWEGDPRLLVAYNSATDQWELWRYEHDATYRMIARKPPGSALDARIIDDLVAQDRRRGFDPEAYLRAHNERVEHAREAAAAEELAEHVPRLVKAMEKENLL